MLHSLDDLKLPFSGRTTELNHSCDFLSPYKDSRKCLFLFGRSGVGKTRFAREIVTRIQKDDENKILLEINWSADTRISEKGLAHFILTLWTCTRGINKENSFEGFIKRKSLNKNAKKSLFLGLKNVLGMLPNYGSIASALLGAFNSGDERPIHINELEIILSYLNHLSKTKSVFLILDNIQNLSEVERSQLLKILSLVENEFGVIIIQQNDKTKNLVEVMQLGLSEFSCAYQRVDNLILPDIRRIIGKSFPEISSFLRDQLSSKCYEVTKGNSREVEQFVLNKKLYGDEISYSPNQPNNSPLVSVVEQLGETDRALLLATSLFPEGLEFEYIQCFINNYYPALDDEGITTIIQFLYDCKLLSMLPEDFFKKIGANSQAIQFIKASHDKVIAAMRESASEDELLEIREALVNTFHSMIDSSNEQHDLLGLISLLVQLAGTHELLRSLGEIEKGIQLLKEREAFKDICFLAKHLIGAEKEGTRSIFSVFSNVTLEAILTSLVKESEFKSALEIIGKCSSKLDKPKVFKARIFAQQYEYEKAINLIWEDIDHLDTLALFLNIRQHQRKDSEVKQIIVDKILSEERSLSCLSEAIILRNSAHLFPGTKGIRNLEKAAEWFKEHNYHFYFSTTKNNKGLAYLGLPSPDVFNAEKLFREALNFFKTINSVEQYQPIFNLGICDLLKGDFVAAKKSFIQAFNVAPEVLEFDLCKFNMNIILVRYIMGEVSKEECLRTLGELSERSNAIPDPWISFAIKYNATSIRDDSETQIELTQLKQRYIGNSSVYGISWMPSGRITNNLILSTSPHWRH